MGKAEYQLAADGFPARVAPSWTEEKLRILSCYLAGFARACKSAGGWYGIDLFAGGGLNISKTTGQQIAGSPLRMLEAGTPAATCIVAVEHQPNLVAALRARAEGFGDRCHIVEGDGIAEIARVLELVERRAPAFAFLDPEGAELAWSVVSAVGGHKTAPAKKVEQLILFPTDTGFVRLLSLNRPLESDYADRVTNMFGHDGWRDIWEARRAGRIQAPEARERYVRLYAEGLRGLGYLHVQERRIAGDRGQPMYYLLFATDHPTGETIMAHCFDKKHLQVPEELGQQSLFRPRVAPRRRTV